MDFNLELVLTIIVLVTGAIWAIDALFFAKKREGEKVPFYVEHSKSFFPVLAIVLILRSFIAEPFQIPSSSMVPTLKVGDFILVNKYTYGIRLPVIRTKILDINEPKRGDVVVFFPPKDKRYFIKRLVGLPGDHITVKNGQLSINGKLQQQTTLFGYPAYQPRLLETEENLWGVKHKMHRLTPAGSLSVDFETTVPAGEYFMMGDNRDNSSDSRVWGTVPEKNIVGKAFFVWLHWKNWSSLPNFSTAGSIK